MNELVERLRSVKWDVISDGDRMPYDPTRECVFVDMRPDDFESLLAEAASALEAVRAEVVKLMNIRADAVHECALANVRAVELEEALRKVAQSLEWYAHGRCRGFDAEALLSTSEAVELAERTLAKVRGHEDSATMA